MTGSHPPHLAIDTLNHFVFLPHPGSGTLSVFSYNASTGVASVVSGSPFSGGGISSPYDAAVDTTNHLVFVTDDTTSGSLSVFSDNPASGALTPVSGSPFPSGSLNDPMGVAVDTTHHSSEVPLKGQKKTVF